MEPGAAVRTMAEEDIIIHPRRGKSEKAVPSYGIFIANPGDARFAHDELRKQGGERRYLHHSDLSVAVGQDLFVAGPAIGTPLATLALEKLIVLGAQRIILYGWCGSISAELRIGDVVIGAQAVSGEGTSRYYPSPGETGPSGRLQARLQNFLAEDGTQTKLVNLWSTDAPYREDRRELRRLQTAQAVSAVDMEYAALCAVSCFRGIEFAAVFLVSDELYGESWQPGFTSTLFKEKNHRLITRLLSYPLS